MAGPLDGLKVIDLTSVVMGPFATAILGDLGADVIKIESPEGDGTRSIGPSRHRGMSSNYLQFNRSKRSVVLDLKNLAGREVLLRLLRDADVLVFSMRPHTMAKLGLAYEAVKGINPRLIYCGVYGFGSHGRYGGKPAYDDLIQGAVAMPTLDMALGGEPRYSPVIVADQTTALTATYSIMAALLARHRTGHGQAIEVPMFETMAHYVLAAHLYGHTFEPPIGQPGYARLLVADRRPYRTRNGYICAIIYNDKHWRAFLALIGRPELFDTDTFRTLASRTAHIGEVYGFLSDTLAGESTEHWVEKLEQADIPVFRLHTLDSLISDPHLKDVGFFEMIKHPSEGRLRTMRNPVTWSGTLPAPQRQAPRLGEHSREVLYHLGYSDTEFQALVAAGVTVDNSDKVLVKQSTLSGGDNDFAQC